MLLTNPLHKWRIFTILAVAQFMVVLDLSIVNVALPFIKTSLNFSVHSLQWVVTAYALCFGGFLLLGGRAADLYGRRRMLLTGIIGFTTFSLLIGLSHAAGLLIALRALQGASAALMAPAALSIVLTTFRDGADRNKALGWWTSIAAGGAAMGLLLGGFITQYINWRWNFFINVPVGITIAILAWRMVPAHASEAEHRDLDLPGAVLVTAGLMTLVFGFSQTAVWGWGSPATFGTLAAGLVLLGLFIRNEARSSHPLMPLSIFRIRNVTGANLVMAPTYATTLGNFFLMSLYLQNSMHFTPFQTGLSFLPFPFVLSIVSNLVPRGVARWGYKRFIVLGPLFVLAAMLWVAHLPAHGHYFTDVLPAFILMPIGMGMIFMPLTAAATSGVPANEAGLASGLISTSQQMGGAVGLSVLSSIAAAGGGIVGYHHAALAAVVFLAVAAMLGITVIRNVRRPAAVLANR
ncbi:MAG TPA: MFS transporter [Candidatus Saccharimonadia bacterium]|nr:MFS transporter [Candidatus Saccharimonadia bacterium]